MTKITNLEDAQTKWKEGSWAGFYKCTRCGELKNCRGPSRAGVMCLGCFVLKNMRSSSLRLLKKVGLLT